MYKLPIVDLRNENLKSGSSVRISTRNQIKHALEDYGCFIALYDKISMDFDKAIFDMADELFNLPIEIKARNISEMPHHGYVGQVQSLPLYETSGIEYANTLEGAQRFTKLMWQHGNNPFCKTSMQFARTVAELDGIIAKMLFESYGLEKYVDSHIDTATYLLRYIKYKAPSEAGTNMGLPTHTDKSFTTILYQNEISGLEIRTRDGEWISVEFPPKSFIVMAGDACRAWSNDRILAPNHRVTLDKDENKTRYTMALFKTLDNIIKVPKELVDSNHPLKFKPFAHVDLLKFCATVRDRTSDNILKDFCEMNMTKKIAKFLGEDMSGKRKGVSSVLALSNAVTNLAASVFGEQKRLEIRPPERKARWNKY